MNYKTYMYSHRTLLPLFNKLFDLEALSLKRKETGLVYCMKNIHQLELWEMELLHDMIETGTANTTEFFINMMTIGQTPRLIKQDAFVGNSKWNNTAQKAFELLEDVKLNLTVLDYEQTYPTMIFELPEKYCNKRELACPQAGPTEYGFEYPVNHHPCFVIINHVKEVNLLNCAVIFDSMQSIKICFSTEDQMDLETALTKVANKERIFKDALEATLEEMEMSARVVRACLNAALICKETGLIELGRDNPSHYNRLERRSKLKANKNKKQEMAWEMRQMPICYRLKVKPILFTSERTSNGTIKPHRRSSYYKMQHYGPANSLRKRIRIPSVFVNEHLLTEQQ